MRKILFIFTICLVYSFSNICLAHWLPKSELFVGGVGPGCTLEYVASVYGQPKEKRWFNSDGVRGVTYIIYILHIFLLQVEQAQEILDLNQSLLLWAIL